MPQEEKLRVLIVDDDPSIVKLLSRFVGGLAFEPVETVYPQQALLLASQQEIPIAVIDLHMPEMEGIELMKSLHLLNGGMQVILMTGDCSAECFHAAVRNGAYDYLWKPIDFSHLSHVLQAARNRVLRRVGL